MANVVLEDLPGGGDSNFGQFTYDFSLPSTGPGAGYALMLPGNPPYNINYKNFGNQLCNLNESDMTPSPYVITPITIYNNHQTVNAIPGQYTHTPSHICDVMGRPGTYGKQYLVQTQWNDGVKATGIYTMTIQCNLPVFAANLVNSAPLSLQGDESGAVTGNTQIEIASTSDGGSPCPAAQSVWAYGYPVFQTGGQPAQFPTVPYYQIGSYRASGGCPSDLHIHGDALQASQVDFCQKNPGSHGFHATRPIDVLFCKTDALCQGYPANTESVVRLNVAVDLSCTVKSGPPQPTVPTGKSNGVITSSKANINPALGGPNVANQSGAAAGVSGGVRQAHTQQKTPADDSTSTESSASTPDYQTLAKGFPWGHTWTANYQGSDHIWKFDKLQDAGFGFFYDKDEQMVSFEVRSDGILHGQYLYCDLVGPYNSKTKTLNLTPDQNADACRDFGPKVVVKVSN